MRGGWNREWGSQGGGEEPAGVSKSYTGQEWGRRPWSGDDAEAVSGKSKLDAEFKANKSGG